MTADAGPEPDHTVRVSLPPAFYDDHMSRGLPSGQEVARTHRRVLVELDEDGHRDLLEDAELYVDMGVAEFGREMLGLIASARATVVALRRAEARW
ncbi:MAG: hypothetical protein K2X97_20715 [Mycobacteriaceae bacterium]|nr:hypothetical protein [Mycobacteriaceae bacterium]